MYDAEPLGPFIKQWVLMSTPTPVIAAHLGDLDYCNSLLYNVPTHKIDRLQTLQNQCARILTKSSRREHITPVLKSLHWLKIQDRITYKILMLTYKSYYNIAPTYLCELISRRESSINTRLGADHHQLIESNGIIARTNLLNRIVCISAICRIS